MLVNLSISDLDNQRMSLSAKAGAARSQEGVGGMLLSSSKERSE